MDMKAIDSECEKILAGFDALIITMGVGQASKVSATELRNVDCDIPSACARGAKKAGVRHVAILSAVGADITKEESWMTGTGAGGGLYAQIKGQVEANVSSNNFVAGTSIYRPAGIYGNSNSPNFLLSLAKFDIFGKYKTIDIDVLAKAMVAGSIAAVEGKGVSSPTIYEGADLFKAGGEGDL